MFSIAKIKEQKIKTEVTLIIIAAFCFFLSFFARFGWFFDLFSHFTLQYMLGFLIFAASLSLQKQWKWVCIALIFAFLTFGKSRLNLDNSLQFTSPKTESTFTVMQFNHFLHNEGLESFAQWVKQENARPDVIVLQEAVPSTIDVAEKVRDFYPYQVHEPRDHAFGMIILSQTPFLTQEKKTLAGNFVGDNFILILTTQPKNAKNPVTFYALHAIPPSADLAQKQRNAEIADAAAMVSKDSSQNKIMIGDWNITPYSPYFSDVLKVSGLHFQSYGLFLNPTWAALFYHPFRIPIDHILFSSNLMQADKKIGYPFGSDHYSLIASYAEK